MPRTGRTHQLRTHTASVFGHPVVGDGKYGGEAAFPAGFEPRLHLHARALALPRHRRQGVGSHRAAAAAYGRRVALSRASIRSLPKTILRCSRLRRERNQAEALLRDRRLRWRPSDGHGITLDGKPVRTPAGRPLAMPDAVLAGALGQGMGRRRGRPSTARPCRSPASSAPRWIWCPQRRADIVEEVAVYVPRPTSSATGPTSRRPSPGTRQPRGSRWWPGRRSATARTLRSRPRLPPSHRRRAPWLHFVTPSRRKTTSRLPG